MKTIFITVGEATVAKNLLRGSFWNELKLKNNLRVVLLVSPEKKEEYGREFGGGDVIIESASVPPPGFGERVRAFLARNALKTGTVTFNQMRRYYEGGNLISLVLQRLVWFLGGRSKLLQKLIRSLELKQSPPPGIKELFDRWRPDLVFATVVINSALDIPVLREAKRRRILNLGMVRGWDNFTSHGFLRVVPDKFLLQNEYLKEGGLKWQFLNPEILEVVGFPQNDAYFENEYRVPREEFLKEPGLNPEARYVLFGAMGYDMFPQEEEIAEVFEEFIEEGKIPRDLIMIYRPHPAFASKLARVEKLKRVVIKQSARYEPGNARNWEIGEKEIKFLINSIIHSEMVINAGSTMGLDAVALGKPAISAAFEKTKMPYWFSAKVFRNHYTHYQDLMKLGGIKAADNKEELAEAINYYLENPARDLKRRESVKKEFLEPLDGKSGRRLARAIFDLLKI